jgi:hypothetical protein
MFHTTVMFVHYYLKNWAVHWSFQTSRLRIWGTWAETSFLDLSRSVQCTPSRPRLSAYVLPARQCKRWRGRGGDFWRAFLEGFSPLARGLVFGGGYCVHRGVPVDRPRGKSITQGFFCVGLQAGRSPRYVDFSNSILVSVYFQFGFLVIFRHARWYIPPPRIYHWGQKSPVYLGCHGG